MAIVYAASASYAHVNTAVGTAAHGDTVIVPAGTETWGTALDTDKGINLIGNGIGNTVITRGSTHILEYVPADYNANRRFRVSGFSFDGDGAGTILHLGEELAVAKPAQTNLRVDHNRFFSSSAVDLDDKAIEHYGQMFGVVFSRHAH